LIDDSWRIQIREKLGRIQSIWGKRGQKTPPSHSHKIGQKPPQVPITQGCGNNFIKLLLLTIKNLKKIKAKSKEVAVAYLTVG